MTLRTAHNPRRLRAQVMIILTAVVVVIAAGLLIARSHRTTPTRRSPGPIAPANTPAHQMPGSASTLPQIALGDLRWVDFNGIRLPVSATDGPRQQEAGLASGFARNARGALLAALHIGVRANAAWGPRIFQPTITGQVVGSDAQVLATNVHNDYERQRAASGIAEGGQLGPVYAVEEGFRWQSFTPDEGAVDLLTAGPGTSPGSTVRAATRIQVLWERDDWRVIAPPGGDWGNSASPVGTTAGFVIFSTAQPTGGG